MARAGLGLKLLQWFIRGVQFGCAALVFAIYCYFLATLANHDLVISNHIRAVTGISGLASLYTLLGLGLLCCLAGHVFTSAIAIFLDICFAAAFIYVAWANRNGASSCDGYLDTPYGQGNANAVANGNANAFTSLPSFRSACRMQTACFAVAIVAIFFFLFSVIVEVFLVRSRKKERRFGPGPHNNYTSGSGSKTGGLFSWRRKKADRPLDAENRLPEHTTPDQMRNSYNTEATAVAHPEAGPAHNQNKYGESGYGHDNAAPAVDYGYESTSATAANPYNGGYGNQQTQPASYQYNDGAYDRRA